jgi:hypothetical protein
VREAGRLSGGQAGHGTTPLLFPMSLLCAG